MIKTKIPVLLFSWNTVRRIGRRLKSIGKIVVKLNPKLNIIFKKLGVDVKPEAYAAASFMSSFIYGLVLSAILLLAFWLTGDVEEKINIAIAAGLGIWMLFLTLHMIYPGIVLKKIAVKEGKDLLFALREIMMDVNSGVPLFAALKNVAEAEYGYISYDFKSVTEKIESGTSEREALRELAIKTESDHVKRAVWQMVNALESGAGMGGALSGIVQSVEEKTYRDIKDYTSNLNFLMLIYMFTAAVIPSLGVTFMVLLSAFGDFGVTIETVSMLVASSAIMQTILIGFMGSTRPEIFGG